MHFGANTWVEHESKKVELFHSWKDGAKKILYFHQQMYNITFFVSYSGIQRTNKPKQQETDLKILPEGGKKNIKCLASIQNPSTFGKAWSIAW